jgi:hypothetical protein
MFLWHALLNQTDLPLVPIFAPRTHVKLHHFIVALRIRTLSSVIIRAIRTRVPRVTSLAVLLNWTDLSIVSIFVATTLVLTQNPPAIHKLAIVSMLASARLVLVLHPHAIWPLETASPARSMMARIALAIHQRATPLTEAARRAPPPNLACAILMSNASTAAANLLLLVVPNFLVAGTNILAKTKKDAWLYLRKVFHASRTRNVALATMYLPMSLERIAVFHAIVKAAPPATNSSARLASTTNGSWRRIKSTAKKSATSATTI